MKIKGTNWYTASAIRGERIEGSERSQIQVLYGYRLPVQGQSDMEIKERITALKEKGVYAKLRTSKNNHTGVPAGTPFLQVLDKRSVAALEKMLVEDLGITLPADRFKEYGLERAVTVPQKAVPPAQKSFFARLFGRG